MTVMGTFAKRMIQFGAKSGVCRPTAAMANTYRSLSSNSSGNKAFDEELPPWAPSKSNSSGHKSDDTQESGDPDLDFPTLALMFVVCTLTTASMQSLDRGKEIKKLQQQMNDISKKMAEIDETIAKILN